jgi:biotin carboxylase
LTEKRKKKILFVGGGIETLPGIILAKSQGLEVLVSDRDPKAMCVNQADHFIEVSTYDIAETIAEIKSFNERNGAIDGVISLATDVPLTVASVAKAFNLPGIPVESAQVSSDKLLMKDLFKKNNLKIPWYSAVDNLEQLIALRSKQIGDLVLKPVDSRGGRGVLLISKHTDLAWAFNTSIRYSPKKRLLVEEYLPGPQVSTESLVIDGVSYTIGFSDRNYSRLSQFEPHIIEDGGDLPSKLSLKQQEKIKRSVEKAAEVLKITDGVIKGDMVLFNNDGYIIEVAPRLSGGYFCSHEIPLNTGVNFLNAALKIALGEKVEKKELVPKINSHVCQRYIFPRNGVVTNIEVPFWIKRNKNIKLWQIRLKIGDKIEKIDSHPARAGLVIATGTTRLQAQYLAEKAIQEIKITVE